MFFHPSSALHFIWQCPYLFHLATPSFRSGKWKEKLKPHNSVVVDMTYCRARIAENCIELKAIYIFFIEGYMWFDDSIILSNKVSTRFL